MYHLGITKYHQVSPRCMALKSSTGSRAAHLLQRRPLTTAAFAQAALLVDSARNGHEAMRQQKYGRRHAHNSQS